MERFSTQNFKSLSDFAATCLLGPVVGRESTKSETRWNEPNVLTLWNCRLTGVSYLISRSEEYSIVCVCPSKSKSLYPSKDWIIYSTPVTVDIEGAIRIPLYSAISNLLDNQPAFGSPDVYAYKTRNGVSTKVQPSRFVSLKSKSFVSRLLYRQVVLWVGFNCLPGHTAPAHLGSELRHTTVTESAQRCAARVMHMNRICVWLWVPSCRGDQLMLSTFFSKWKRRKVISRG